MTTTRSLLLAERARACRRAAALEREFAGIADAAGGPGADDEHDPEGATLAFERQHTAALLARALEQLAEIDAAIGRLGDGTYGTCLRCGQPVGQGRLAARPAAATCVRCARLPSQRSYFGASTDPSAADSMIAMFDGTDTSSPNSVIATPVGATIFAVVANDKGFHQSDISIQQMSQIFVHGEPGVVAVGRLRGSGSRKALLSGTLHLPNWQDIPVAASTCPPPSGMLCIEDYTSQGVHSRGAVSWCQLMAASGGSQGFPSMAARMASSAVVPWAAAVSR